MAEQNDDEGDYSVDDSVMGEYAKAVQLRLQEEVKPTTTCQLYLLLMLKNDDWILPACHAKKICDLLKLPFHEPSYYRDVVIWLPDVRWGAQAMPYCPNCRSNTKVGVHGWRDNHVGRRITTMTSNYFILSRRYICHECERNASSAKVAAMLMAEEHGLQVMKGVEDATSVLPNPSYTFMGWDQASISLLPNGYGDLFPAMLTSRGGVDNHIVDFMRAAFDKGVRPESFSDMMLEFHTKKYTQDYSFREHNLSAQRASVVPFGNSHHDPGMFSHFGDKKQYNGMVSTERYLAFIYKKYNASILDHLNREVMKRGCDHLKWDASYKGTLNRLLSPICLTRVHGLQLTPYSQGTVVTPCRPRPLTPTIFQHRSQAPRSASRPQYF